MKIQDLQLSTRLSNILKAANLETLKDLSEIPSTSLMGLRSMGITSAQELALILMKRFYKPKWLSSVARDFNFDTISEEEAAKQRYRSITSGFTISEYHLLMGVIADMERGHCAYRLVKVNGTIEVCRPGDSIADVTEEAA